MFDDLISKIKNSLPEKLREKLGSEDDDEYEEEEEGEEEEESSSDKTGEADITEILEDGDEEELGDVDLDELDDEEEGTEPEVSPKSKAKKKSKKDDDDEDDDEDEEEEEDDDEPLSEEEKAAKKKKVIQIVLGVVIVGLIASEFMPAEDPVPVPVIAKKKKKKRKKRIRKKKKPTEIVAKPVEAAPVVEQPVVPPPAPKVAEPVVPAPAPKVAEPVTPPPPAPVEVAVKPKTIDIPPETAAGLPVVAEPVAPAAGGGEVVAADPKTTGMDGKMDALISNIEQGASSDMSSMITPDKSKYVEPPTYLRPGRGLVYNCKGKHWACVDKFSYFTCKDNLKWATSSKQNPECVAKDVYASMKDCRIVQVHFINTNLKTAFCYPGSAPAEAGEEKTDITPESKSPASEAPASN
ncbi:MAG: hypothetical protein HN509_03855 [Halobacteriovoraceae bacterium]|jgi:hypothetical protein|nr:hypothetical protein [Halobacteriovoraceae bacterium]MBT5093009.1 hypothetical protein [Halobacteriovoraceae bacterium]